MEDGFWSKRVENGIHPFCITDIPFANHEASIVAINMQILVRTSGEIVDDTDSMSGIDTGIDEVRADESGSSGDQYFHRDRVNSVNLVISVSLAESRKKLKREKVRNIYKKSALFYFFTLSYFPNEGNEITSTHTCPCTLPTLSSHCTNRCVV